MKIYRPRPGIVYLSVCGEHLLVATGEARKSCPYITQINEKAASLWKCMQEQEKIDNIAKLIPETSQENKGSELLSAIIFIGKMSKAGYLLIEEEG